MRVLQGTSDFQIEKRSAVAIGKFDGLHRGHQKLIEKVMSYREEGLQTIIFTFDLSDSPFEAAAPKRELSTREEKRHMMESMGIDVLIEFPLNELTAKIEPKEFVERILSKELQVKKMIAGSDVSFGFKGGGNALLLKEMALKLDYEAVIIDKICYERREISSSYVREKVESGSMQLVEKLLGYPYSITGSVVYGNQIGRTMNFPTVNLLPQATKLLPPKGVYFSNVLYKGQKFCGITNIGTKPSVSEEDIITVETYILDFEKEIYGQMVTVQLRAFRRPEVKFESLEALEAQIGRDKEAGKIFFATDKE